MFHIIPPLKVLHICQRDDPATGGAVRVAVEYAKRLPEYDIDAHCLFLYGPPGAFSKELGARAHYLGLNNSHEFYKFWQLISFLDSFRPQAIHHHDGLLWSHLLTVFHSDILKISHAHLPATKAPFTRGALASWVQRQSTDLLVCITEDIRRSQISQGKYHPNRTQVLYNGVDFDRFYPPSIAERAIARKRFGIPIDIHLVGFVGRLHCAMKGTDDFLKMATLLPPNYCALVVGSGPDADFLKKLAKTLQIDNRVLFTGILEDTAIAYHAMDIFCITSHWEPFGLVVAEAMACHLPVVGFSCPGGINEILTPETGYLVPDRDLQKMAQVVVEAVEQPKLWSQRQINCQLQLQKKHNWVSNTAELAKLYNSLWKYSTNQN